MNLRLPLMMGRVLLGLCVCWLSACAVKPAQESPREGHVVVRVIGLNDFHGQLESAGLTLSMPDPRHPALVHRVPTGGASELAGLLAALRAGAQHHLTLSSGDLIGATPLVSALFRHEPTIDIANRIGVDLAIPGNHEFDAGRDEFIRLLEGGCTTDPADSLVKSCAMGRHDGARFKTFAANIVKDAGGTLFAPFVVRSFEGVPVAFIGAVTRSTPGIVMPSGVQGLRFTDEAEAINAQAKRLKDMGVHALVAVIHEGGTTGEPGAPMRWNDAECPRARGEIFDIVRRLSPEIDIVFSAHTHQGYGCVIDGRPVMQATALGRGVSVADLVIDRRTGDVDRALTRHRNLPVLRAETDPAIRQALIDAEPAPWAQALREARPSAEVQARVAQYLTLAEPQARKPVGRIAGAFDRASRTDSSAGRLIADAQWEATRDPQRGGAQAALMNPGGIRTDLRCATSAPCDVSYGELFAMQPFGNSLVVMTLSGDELRALLEQQQRPGRAYPTFLSPSASLTYSWNAKAPQGERVNDLRLAGVPVQASQTVRLTVNSFLAEGGDGYSLLRQGRDKVGGVLDIEALIDHLRRREPGPETRDRVRWID